MKNDTIHKTMLDKNINVINDGILTLKTTLSRKINTKGGYDYFIEESTTSTTDYCSENINLPKDPYWFKVDGNKIIEIRLKIPAKSLNALDFFEVTTQGEGCSGKNILVRGWPTYYVGTERAYYDYNSSLTKKYGYDNLSSSIDVGNVEEWCKEFHTFTFNLSPTSLICYLDGTKYKELDWGNELGAIPADQEYSLRLHNEHTNWVNVKNVNWKADNYEEIQVDYVRVYKELE